MIGFFPPSAVPVAGPSCPSCPAWGQCFVAVLQLLGGRAAGRAKPPEGCVRVPAGSPGGDKGWRRSGLCSGPGIDPSRGSR